MLRPLYHSMTHLICVNKRTRVFGTPRYFCAKNNLCNVFCVFYTEEHLRHIYAWKKLQIISVGTDYLLDTLHWDRIVLSFFYALCFICENSDNAPSKSSGVRMCSTGVTRGPVLDAIRPNSGLVIVVLFMSNVLLLMCQNKPTTKLFHSTR